IAHRVRREIEREDTAELDSTAVRRNDEILRLQPERLDRLVDPIEAGRRRQRLTRRRVTRGDRVVGARRGANGHGRHEKCRNEFAHWDAYFGKPHRPSCRGLSTSREWRKNTAQSGLSPRGAQG